MFFLKEEILDLFYQEIISELQANKGKFNICDNTYYFPFQVMVEDKRIVSFSSTSLALDCPTLIIKDPSSFNRLYTEYLSLQYQFIKQEAELNHYLVSCCGNDTHLQLKYLSLLLWKNATAEDFLDPNTFLKRRISFLKQKENTVHLMGKIDSLEEVNIQSKISKQFASLETPYCFQTSFTASNTQEVYPLPEISFGVFEDAVYLYSIKGKKRPAKEKQSSFFKKIDRFLYKANQDVVPDQEYLAYIQGNDEYYPENISDISVSTLYSLTMFLKYLEINHLSKIVTVSFLPLRYLAKEQALFDSLTLYRMFYSPEKIESIYLAGLVTIERDLSNQTEKLVRTLRRLAYHFPSLEISSYPFDMDSSLYLNRKDRKLTSNHVLTELYNHTQEQEKSRK